MKHTMSRHTFYSLTVTFTILSILGQLSTSIYSPFFFDLAAIYDSYVGIIEKSVAVFLIAFSLSQLVSGVACDYLNKQKFLLYGVLVFIAGTLMVALATEENTFLVGRVIQGLGGGVGVSVSRGLSRQIFSEKQMNASLFVYQHCIRYRASNSATSRYTNWRVLRSFIYLLFCTSNGSIRLTFTAFSFHHPQTVYADNLRERLWRYFSAY